MDNHDARYDIEKQNQYLPPDFEPLNARLFDRDVWEPHFWFFFSHRRTHLSGDSQLCYETKIL